MCKKEFKKKFASYNMRGRMSEGRSKYGIVEDFIRNDYSVIALQEAGPDFATQPLPNTTPIPRINVTNPDNVDGSGLSAHNWRVGTETRGRNVFQYFLNWDEGGHRVNLAMVSAVQADRVILLQRHQSSTSERPILGIQIGNHYFFNIHAKADGGSNAPDLVRRVRDFMAEQSNAESWMIMGDFNREPETLNKELDEETKKDVKIKAPKWPTHYGARKSILDYAVVDSETEMQVFNPTLPIMSDHSPVLFATTTVLLEEKKERLEKEQLEKEQKEKLEKKQKQLDQENLKKEQFSRQSHGQQSQCSPQRRRQYPGQQILTKLLMMSSTLRNAFEDGIDFVAPYVVGGVVIGGLVASGVVPVPALVGKALVGKAVVGNVALGTFCKVVTSTVATVATIAVAAHAVGKKVISFFKNWF